MENENITKSIIYGNVFENRYGKFLPVCSSIMERASINNIVEYLKSTPHFKKYNRVAYAYRVDQMPVVFITEKKNMESQFYDGCHSDETVEGSGEKLLHLLEKFNIRNVFIGVLVQQYHPLLPFECTNYRAIVENSRTLLDELYKKVLQFQEQSVDKNINNLLLNQDKVLKMNKVDIAEEIKIPEIKKRVPKERPNNIHSTGNLAKASFSTKKLKKPSIINQQQLQFLWERCKSMKEQYKKISDSISQKQMQQMRYYVMYDKNPTINIVIQMFMLFQNVSKEHIVEQFDFKAFLSKQLQMLEGAKLKKLDQIIKTNKKINVDEIIKINKGLGLIFSLMDLTIRYSNNLDRISSQVSKAEKTYAQTQEAEHAPQKNVKIDTVL